MAKSKVITGEDILKNEIIEKKGEKYLQFAEIKIKEALKIQDEISELNFSIQSKKKALAEIEKLFLSDLKHGESIETMFGTATKKVSNTYSLISTKIDDLKKLFKRNFKNFVQATESYSATTELKKILNNPKHENQKEVANCFEIRTSEAIKFTESKKAKK